MADTFLNNIIHNLIYQIVQCNLRVFILNFANFKIISFRLCFSKKDFDRVSDKVMMHFQNTLLLIIDYLSTVRTADPCYIDCNCTCTQVLRKYFHRFLR